jgi:hypothetical protein
MRLFCLSIKYPSHIHKDKSSGQSVVQSSHCCSVKKRMKISASSQFMNERISNWMKNERKEKKRKMPKLVPELPGHFRTLRSYRPPRLGRERDVGAMAHRQPPSPQLPRSCYALWWWWAWLGPNTFCFPKTLLFFSHLKLTYLLTYLLAHEVSPPSPLGDGGPTDVSPPPPSPPPPTSFCARDLTSAARSRDHEEGSSKAEKELHSLAKLWQN